jgi:dipeptidyl aminopeptidase/acylaminoacyl peptidase
MLTMLRLSCVAMLCAMLLVPAALAQAPIAAGEPTRIAGSEDYPLMRPVFSPIGDRVAVSGSNFAGLYLVEITSGELSRLTDEAAAGYGAEWSHDGSAILARVAQIDGVRRQHAVKLFDVTTREAEQLTDYRPSMRALPRWAPDGARVYLPADDRVEVLDAGARVASKAIDASARTMLVANGALAATSAADPTPRIVERADRDIFRVATTRDGHRVAYEVLGGNLFVMNVDGSGKVDLGRGEAARFSPDGEWVVFMRTEDDGHHITGSDLFAARVADGQIFRLTHTPDRFEMNPDWSPDGNAIVYDDRGAVYLLPVQR